MKKGFLYVISSPTFKPNVFMIGFTTQTVKLRTNEIFRGSSGSIAPFSIKYELPVLDCELAKMLIHRKLERFRCSGERECFYVDLAHIKHLCFHVIDDINFLFDDTNDGFREVSIASADAGNKQALEIKYLASNTSELTRFLVGDRVWMSGARVSYGDFSWTEHLYEETSELLCALQDLTHSSDDSISSLWSHFSCAGSEAKLAISAWLQDDEDEFVNGFDIDWIYSDVACQLRDSGFVAVKLTGKLRSLRYGVIAKGSQDAWYYCYLDSHHALASSIRSTTSADSAVLGVVRGKAYQLLPSDETVKLNLLNILSR